MYKGIGKSKRFKTSELEEATLWVKLATKELTKKYSKKKETD